MKYTRSNLPSEIAATERGRQVLKTFIPDYEQYANVDFNPIGTFGQGYHPEGMPRDIADQIVRALNGPIESVIPQALSRKSLDEVDLESFQAGPSPLDGPAVEVELRPMDETPTFRFQKQLSLDGEWALTEDLGSAPDWDQAIPAQVPGSVHMALFRAGRLPDPCFGRNQEIAREASYKSWYLRRRFHWAGGSLPQKLCFDGVCNRCQVWLNGTLLGDHEGMFGGPEWDVSALLREENELVVRLEAIPQEFEPSGPIVGKKPHLTSNSSWKRTVVSNNVYGWHYSNLPSLGIWNSVHLDAQPELALRHPFIATMDAASGAMRATVEIAARPEAWSGTLRGIIEPKNFSGKAWSFETDIDQRNSKPRLSFSIPEPRLWWPNGLGEQNLYTLTLTLTSKDGLEGESISTTFGIRTVRMAPLADGPKEDSYNWHFIINGKPSFIKGTGWCTMDALMDFSRARYDRFLHLAQIQNCQMIRAWGAGMPEKDDFYELCDQYGIMVMQEWPTAWDSHLTQPYEMLEDTVVRNTLRIRNHPSLILYCPGNESMNPYGKAIDMMGRRSVELDGTRAFHRGEPWGGSVHNYDSYWGRQSMDVHVNLTGKFFGEFGIACTPCAESVNRYLPEAEKNLWPPVEDGAFEYHTPIFGTADDISRLKQMVGYFAKPDCSFEQMTIASQLSQIVGVRHTLERARIRYPYCGGALYYKLNDNFPAMSWASVDWYGAPKLGHYVFQKSFAPTAAFVLPKTLNFNGTAHRLPLYLVDDLAQGSSQYQVLARVYNGKLERILEKTFEFEGEVSIPDQIGSLDLPYEDCCTPPILISIQLSKDGRPVFNTFYFFNYEARQGCLFELPKTRLALATRGGTACIENLGDYPAVGVCVSCPGQAYQFTAWENFIWLEPGERRSIRVDRTEGLAVSALNA